MVIDDEVTIGVLLADSQSLFREAVRVVLEGEAGLRVVSDVPDATRAVSDAQRLRPDVAILGTTGSDDALRATRAIRERVPTCRVMLITDGHDEDLLMRALLAGASGYVTKASCVGALIEGVRSVHAGQVLVPQEMLDRLLDRLIRERRERDIVVRRTSSLTRREREVLVLLTRGCGNEAIADELVISPQTARTHVQNVIAKLGVHSRLEAAMCAAQSGFVDEPYVDLGDPLDHEMAVAPHRRLSDPRHSHLRQVT